VSQKPLRGVSGERVRVDLGETDLSSDRTAEDGFSEFVVDHERGLRQALTAWLGPDLGREATAEALAYGWENWGRVGAMDNAAGYLYRTGLNWGRKSRRRRDLVFPEASQSETEWYEPGLPAALASLSDQQRVVVFLVHGHQWSLSEVAALLEISKGTVQTHMERGMERLRRELKVET
jgi:RNA polymerase sigma factor (sigma-70 family)